MTKRPTAAQLKVLRAMADGTVLVRGYVNHVRWYLQGSGASVNANTAESLRQAEWIGCADNSGVYRYHTLTESGRSILMKEKK